MPFPNLIQFGPVNSANEWREIWNFVQSEMSTTVQMRCSNDSGKSRLTRN